MHKVLFGDIVVSENTEHQVFLYKLLVVLMVTGAVFTASLVFGSWLQINPIDGPHLYSMQLFTVLVTVLWLSLRGRQRYFIGVAWLYEIICLLEYLSALLFVPQDELRILWFYLNIPGVYIILGKQAGRFITLITAIIFLVSPYVLQESYSPNAMATALLSLLYLAIFFDVFIDRTTSYYLRMRSSNMKMQYMANHDALTGLYNARAYYEQVERIMASQSAASYSILFVDLDFFKRINDGYGHAAGDDVLKAVARAIESCLGEQDMAGRIGGEEFSVFLPMTASKEALQIAEKLRETIEQLCIQSQGIEDTIRLTASIGVANAVGVSLVLLQQQADHAMYQAKATGRNRVTAFASVL